MRPVTLLLQGLACICSLLACSGNDSDSTVGSESPCIPGSSVACAGPSGCPGYQICRADGSAFESCICEGSSVGVGGARPATTAVAYGGSSLLGLGGSGATSASYASLAGNAGTGSAVTSRDCAPADMTGHSYPPYKPARRLFATCTQADVEDYYANCYVSGACTDFAPGGSRARCGECLATTNVDADSYGPLIRMGTAASPLDETNMAGCIELMGEADCAPKMMVAALCEYSSCASNCTVTDAASYQTLMSCMLDARSTSCSAAERAAVCISNSAHVAACSATGFQAQFIAIAKVFCVQNI
ncbi:MAG TPA: hypothetical protein VIV60_00920 [Polyangiaceae bacterium]